MPALRQGFERQAVCFAIWQVVPAMEIKTYYVLLPIRVETKLPSQSGGHLQLNVLPKS